MYLPTSRSFVEVRFCQLKVRIRILFTVAFIAKPRWERARDRQNMFGRTRFRISKFFSINFITEPLYEYPQTSISPRVFHYTANRRFFSSEIVAYETDVQNFFCVVTLLTSSVQPQRRRKRENSERAAHFLLGLFGIIAGLTLSIVQLLSTKIVHFYDKSMKLCQITNIPKTNISGYGAKPNSPLDSSTAQDSKRPT